MAELTLLLTLACSGFSNNHLEINCNTLMRKCMAGSTDLEKAVECKHKFVNWQRNHHDKFVQMNKRK